MSSQFGLFKTRRFAPLFGTQFLGAFNDNLYKNALVVLLTAQTAQWTSMRPEILSSLAAGIFILPYFFFSATAGQLADKYDKAWLARLSKVLEVVIMLVAALGFWMTSLPVLMVALFLLGAQSTFFGPVKYAILPQHLGENELVGGNAMVEAGTFVAILIGTLAGGVLAGVVSHPVWIAVVGLAIALFGYLASRGIPVAPAPAPDLKVNFNFMVETWRNIRLTRKNRTVFLSILGISWFWLYGALFLAQLPAYGLKVLGGTEAVMTLLLATFTVGIGVGSMLCERLSGKHVEMGLVPLGSIGLTVFALDLGLFSPLPPAAGTVLTISQLLVKPEIWRVLFDLTLLGVFGGFFTVPLYAMMQVYSARETRARTVAANNIFNALFMVLGAGAAAGILALGATIPQLFLATAIGNALVALYIYGLLPEFLQRFVVWLVVCTATRLETEGVEQNVPERGGALLCYEAESAVHVLCIMAACRRPIRFVCLPDSRHTFLLDWLMRQGRAFRFSSVSGAGQSDIAAALAAGEVLAVAHGALAEAWGNACAVPVLRLTIQSAGGGRVSQLWGKLCGLPFLDIFPAVVALSVLPCAGQAIEESRQEGS